MLEIKLLIVTFVILSQAIRWRLLKIVYSATHHFPHVIYRGFLLLLLDTLKISEQCQGIRLPQTMPRFITECHSSINYRNVAFRGNIPICVVVIFLSMGDDRVGKNSIKCLIVNLHSKLLQWIENFPPRQE